MMKISKKTKAILNALESLVEKIPGSVLRFSAREVPHVVVDHKYSICWFAVAKEYRIWEGYATPQNRKIAAFIGFLLLLILSLASSITTLIAFKIDLFNSTKSLEL